MLAAATPLLAAAPLVAVVTAMIALGLRASLAGAIGLALAFGLLPLGFDLSAGGTLPVWLRGSLQPLYHPGTLLAVGVVGSAAMTEARGAHCAGRAGCPPAARAGRRGTGRHPGPCTRDGACRHD